MSLQETLYLYFLKNNLEDNLKPYHFLHKWYLIWKDNNYFNCSCCNKLCKKDYICEICGKYYYCLECWDDYTYFCFYCNKHHCFCCNVKRKACINCFRR